MSALNDPRVRKLVGKWFDRGERRDVTSAQRTVYRECAGELYDALRAIEDAPAAEPIGMIDAGEDGYFVELYPDRDLRIGAEVYTAPPPAALDAERVLSEYVRICIAEHHDDAPKEARVEAMRRALLAAAPLQEPSSDDARVECHGLDTPERVRFYEHDFYPLSNFSAFAIVWDGRRFDTSEAAYHYEKFRGNPALREKIWAAQSAHEAFKLAEQNKALRRPDWDAVKVSIMRDILRAKVNQHEYVRRKLLATGERELVEDSWRDDYWGWGPNRDGQNMLGKLWMGIRDDLRAAQQPEPQQ